MTNTQPSNPVIPMAAKIAAGIAFWVTAAAFGVWFIQDPNWPGWALFVLVLVPSIFATYIMLVGYVYGDARRRGMRYVMWTWLAILIPNSLGIILYFILRDPMPVYCSKCGGMSKPGFAYCAKCGSAMAACCPGCQRVSQKDWTHCAYCGTALV